MAYNPDTWVTETLFSEAEHLRRMLIHYFESGAGEAFWKAEVVPLIEKLAATTIRTAAGQYAPMGVKGAVALTGDFIVEKGAVIWVRNKTTKMILIEAGEFAEASLKGLVSMANVFGWVLFLTADASAESTELRWEYVNYLKKYLTYIIKAASLGGNHIQHLKPPMDYTRFLERNLDELWWMR